MDDRALYDFYIAPRAGAALAVAVRTGLIEWLAHGSRSAAEIAVKYAWNPRPTDGILTALTAMRVLRRARPGDPGAFFDATEVYELTPEADRFLVPGRSEDLSGLIAMDFDNFVTPAGLLKSMERDAPQVYGDVDPWDVHGEDAERARGFAKAMKSISARPANALAAMDFWKDRRRLIDVGGGSGVFAIAALEAWKHLEAVIYEIPAVCPLARELADESGVGDRLETVAGNMFKDEWPTDGDVILLSQILHDWPPDKGMDLLRKAHAALPSGGIVLIHEKLLDDARESPVANALVNLDMLFWTEGQQYSAPQVRRSLEAAGFVDVAVFSTIGYWSIAIGRRAGHSVLSRSISQ